MKIKVLKRHVYFIAAMSIAKSVIADGILADKIYNPYVHPFEKELEWRNIYVDDNNHDRNQLWLSRVGYSQSFAESWAAELYVLGDKVGNNGIEYAGTEIELKHQLTEQGEYSADWGLLFEIENEDYDDTWEAATTLIAATDIQQWTLTGNAAIIYEWGNHTEDEFETALSLQAAYRYSPLLLPALEVYVGQDNLSFGPVLLGTIPVAAGKKLMWELGWLHDNSDNGADQIVKAHIEFEFW